MPTNQQLTLLVLTNQLAEINKRMKELKKQKDECSLRIRMTKYASRMDSVKIDDLYNCCEKLYLTYGQFWPEAEPYIMKDPQFAYCYAKFVLCNRWAEAEPFIMKDPNWAYMYAKYIINGRWPEAESCIAKDKELMSRYMQYCNM